VRSPRGSHFEEAIATSVEIPFEQTTKRVLEAAATEADRLLHHHIGTEHLLLGLLYEEHCDAAQILVGHGLRLDAVRQEIVALFNPQDDTLR
jgi:ATP-dependent Clp protease ATP-binding subunit ClpC